MASATVPPVHFSELLREIVGRDPRRPRMILNNNIAVTRCTGADRKSRSLSNCSIAGGRSRMGRACPARPDCRASQWLIGCVWWSIDSWRSRVLFRADITPTAKSFEHISNRDTNGPAGHGGSDGRLQAGRPSPCGEFAQVEVWKRILPIRQACVRARPAGRSHPGGADGGATGGFRGVGGRSRRSRSADYDRHVTLDWGIFPTKPRIRGTAASRRSVAPAGRARPVW